MHRKVRRDRIVAIWPFFCGAVCHFLRRAKPVNTGIAKAIAVTLLVLAGLKPVPGASVTSPERTVQPFAKLCPALTAGYSTCGPILGPAPNRGEDLRIGYDINGASGNLFISEVDINVRPGDGPPLDFVRYYNSQANGIDIGMGANWTHTYSWRLVTSGNEIIVITDTGRIIHFTNQGGQYVAEPGEFGSLATLSIGWSYTTKYGTAYTFDQSGRLTSIKPADDGPITVNYVSSAGRQIGSVTSGSLTVGLAYSGSEISSITSPSGAVWNYSYGGEPSWAKSIAQLTQFFNNQANPPAGAQLLSDVSAPTTVEHCGPITAQTGSTHRLYSYSFNQLFDYPANPSVPLLFAGQQKKAELTGYAMAGEAENGCVLKAPTNQPTTGQVAVVGLFNYDLGPASQSDLLYGAGFDPPDVVSTAAAGVTSGYFVRPLQFQFAGSTLTRTVVAYIAIRNAETSPDVTAPGSITFPGIVNRTATSGFPAGNGDPRLISLNSSGGAGTTAEVQTEGWQWNTNLTMASHTDGNGNVTSYGNYENLGNATTITEGVGSSAARTTNYIYHPVLSRPLTITRPSVDGNPSHSYILTYDYSATYGTGPYNQSPITPFVHQIIETGYTDTGLTGALQIQVSHVTQMKWVAPSISAPSHMVIQEISGPLPGAQTSFSYTPVGYLSSVSRLAQVSTRTVNIATQYTQYDLDGRLTRSIDANNNVHAFTFDQAGRPLTVSLTSADGTATLLDSFTYAPTGVQIGHKTPGGAVLATAYDPALRPVETQGIAANGTIAWTQIMDLNSDGRPLTSRLFGGAGTDTGPGCQGEQFCQMAAYNPFTRLSAVYFLDDRDNPCGQSCGASYSYDGNLRISNRSILDDPNVFYSFGRDSLNRISGITATAPGTVSTLRVLNYDINDRINSRTDTLGNVTTYLYDDFGSLIQLSSLEAGTWITNYDTAGDVTAVSDPSGRQTAYQYDTLGRRVNVHTVTSATQQPSDADDVSYVYDETGVIGGTTLQFSNSIGRLTSVLASGNHNSAWAPGGQPLIPIETHFSYDFAGRTTTEVNVRGSDPFVAGVWPTTITSYTWGPDHELQSLAYPDGQIVSFKYSGSSIDLRGTPLPSEVDSNFGGNGIALLSNAQFAANGQPSSFNFANGSVVQVTRNKRGEIVRVLSGNPKVPLISESYGYGPNQIGFVTSITQNGLLGRPREQRQISYNPLGWITNYTRSAPSTLTQSFNWTYDNNGNTNTLSYGDSSGGNSSSTASYIAGTNLLTQPSYIAVGNYSATPAGSNGAAYGYDGGQLFAIPAPDINEYSGAVYVMNNRHRLSEVDTATLPFSQWGYAALGHEFFNPANVGDLPFAEPTYLYIYDGLDRLWQRFDNVSNLYLTGSGNTSQTQEQGGGGVHQYYYDTGGRIAEEFDSLGCPGSNGACNGQFLDTEHVYLGSSGPEIARIVRTWKAGATLQAQDLTDVQIQFLHKDGRGTIAAIETMDTARNGGGAVISPLYALTAFSPLGPSAVMATEEQVVSGTLPASFSNLISGASGQPLLDGGLSTSVTCNSTTGYCPISGVLDIIQGRTISPSKNIFNPYAWSTYIGDTAQIGPGGAGSGDAESHFETSQEAATAASSFTSEAVRVLSDTTQPMVDINGGKVTVDQSMLPYLILALHQSSNFRSKFQEYFSPDAKYSITIRGECPTCEDNDMGLSGWGAKNRAFIEIDGNTPGIDDTIVHEFWHIFDSIRYNSLPNGDIPPIGMLKANRNNGPNKDIWLPDGSDVNAGELAYRHDRGLGIFTPIGPSLNFSPGLFPINNPSTTPWVWGDLMNAWDSIGMGIGFGCQTENCVSTGSGQ